MKKCLVILMVAVLATAAQAGVLAWESFGYVTENGTANGYSGTAGVSESGFAAVSTWSTTTNAYATIERANTAGDWTPRGVTGGVAVDEIGDNMHWLETNAWNVDSGTRTLASSIDLTTASTYYMSFFSQAGGYDTVLQIGLANASNELMWGNGWNRGLTAYYGGIGTAPDTNNNGTNMDGGSYHNWDTAFWVAEIVSDGTDVTVNISQYNLDSTGGLLSSPTLQTIALAGAGDVFDSLAFKIDGASNQYPGIDEFRLGETLADVTIPEPATLVLLGLGGVLLRRKK